MTKLVLSNLPGFSSSVQGAVFLASHTAICGKSTGEASTTLPYPLHDKETWKKAWTSSQKRYGDAMVHLANWLDTYHGEQLGHRYWETVAGWFLTILCDVVTERQSVIQDALKTHPGIGAIGLATNHHARPEGPRQFEAAIRHDPLVDLQIKTRIAMAMGLKLEFRALPEKMGPFAKSHAESRPKGPGPEITTPKQPLADIWFYKTLMRRRRILQLSAATGFRVATIPEIADPVDCGYVDDAARASLALCFPEDPVLMSVCAQLLPTCYLEGWAPLAQSARNQISNKRPQVIVTGLGGFWNTYFAIWMAECQRHGTRVIGVQHGGCYGERDQTSFEHHERRIADRYATWGWREDEKTVPLPAARLSGIPKFSRSPNGPVLWVGTSDSPHCYQLGPRPVGLQFLQYFETQKRFAAHLNGHVAANTLFRPYPADFGWKNLPGSDAAPMAVQTDDFSATFWERVRQSRLVVVDHPGSTTFLEALAAGRPVLCFCASDLFDIRPSAQPFYDDLERAGIYHRSIESAADTLNQNFDDIEAWWLDPTRQTAIAAFREHFARNDGFLRKWREFLLHERWTAKRSTT